MPPKRKSDREKKEAEDKFERLLSNSSSSAPTPKTKQITYGKKAKEERTKKQQQAERKRQQQEEEDDEEDKEEDDEEADDEEGDEEGEAEAEAGGMKAKSKKGKAQKKGKDAEDDADRDEMEEIVAFPGIGEAAVPLVPRKIPKPPKPVKVEKDFKASTLESRINQYIKKGGRPNTLPLERLRKHKERSIQTMGIATGKPKKGGVCFIISCRRHFITHRLWRRWFYGHSEKQQELVSFVWYVPKQYGRPRTNELFTASNSLDENDPCNYRRVADAHFNIVKVQHALHKLAYTRYPDARHYILVPGDSIPIQSIGDFTNVKYFADEMSYCFYPKQDTSIKKMKDNLIKNLKTEGKDKALDEALENIVVMSGLTITSNQHVKVYCSELAEQLLLKLEARYISAFDSVCAKVKTKRGIVYKDLKFGESDNPEDVKSYKYYEEDIPLVGETGLREPNFWVPNLIMTTLMETEDPVYKSYEADLSFPKLSSDCKKERQHTRVHKLVFESIRSPHKKESSLAEEISEAKDVAKNVQPYYARRLGTGVLTELNNDSGKTVDERREVYAFWVEEGTINIIDSEADVDDYDTIYTSDTDKQEEKEGLMEMEEEDKQGEEGKEQDLDVPGDEAEVEKPGEEGNDEDEDEAIDLTKSKKELQEELDRISKQPDNQEAYRDALKDKDKTMKLTPKDKDAIFHLRSILKKMGFSVKEINNDLPDTYDKTNARKAFKGKGTLTEDETYLADILFANPLISSIEAAEIILSTSSTPKANQREILQSRKLENLFKIGNERHNMTFRLPCCRDEINQHKSAGKKLIASRAPRSKEVAPKSDEQPALNAVAPAPVVVEESLEFSPYFLRKIHQQENAATALEMVFNGCSLAEYNNAGNPVQYDILFLKGEFLDESNKASTLLFVQAKIAQYKTLMNDAVYKQVINVVMDEFQFEAKEKWYIDLFTNATEDKSLLFILKRIRLAYFIPKEHVHKYLTISECYIPVLSTFGSKTASEIIDYCVQRITLLTSDVELEDIASTIQTPEVELVYKSPFMTKFEVAQSLEHRVVHLFRDKQHYRTFFSISKQIYKESYNTNSEIVATAYPAACFEIMFRLFCKYYMTQTQFKRDGNVLDSIDKEVIDSIMHKKLDIVDKDRMLITQSFEFSLCQAFAYMKICREYTGTYTDLAKCYNVVQEANNYIERFYIGALGVSEKRGLIRNMEIVHPNSFQKVYDKKNASDYANIEMLLTHDPGVIDWSRKLYRKSGDRYEPVLRSSNIWTLSMYYLINQCPYMKNVNIYAYCQVKKLKWSISDVDEKLQIYTFSLGKQKVLEYIIKHAQCVSNTSSTLASLSLALPSSPFLWREWKFQNMCKTDVHEHTALGIMLRKLFTDKTWKKVLEEIGKLKEASLHDIVCFIHTECADQTIADHIVKMYMAREQPDDVVYFDRVNGHMDKTKLTREGLANLKMDEIAHGFYAEQEKKTYTKYEDQYIVLRFARVYYNSVKNNKEVGPGRENEGVNNTPYMNSTRDQVKTMMEFKFEDEEVQKLFIFYYLREIEFAGTSNDVSKLIKEIQNGTFNEDAINTRKTCEIYLNNFSLDCDDETVKETVSFWRTESVRDVVGAHIKRGRLTDKSICFRGWDNKCLQYIYDYVSDIRLLDKDFTKYDELYVVEVLQQAFKLHVSNADIVTVINFCKTHGIHVLESLNARRKLFSPPKNDAFEKKTMIELSALYNENGPLYTIETADLEDRLYADFTLLEHLEKQDETKEDSEEDNDNDFESQKVTLAYTEYSREVDCLIQLAKNTVRFKNAKPLNMITKEYESLLVLRVKRACTATDIHAKNVKEKLIKEFYMYSITQTEDLREALPQIYPDLYDEIKACTLDTFNEEELLEKFFYRHMSLGIHYELVLELIQHVFPYDFKLIQGLYTRAATSAQLRIGKKGKRKFQTDDIDSDEDIEENKKRKEEAKAKNKEKRREKVTFSKSAIVYKIQQEPVSNYLDSKDEAKLDLEKIKTETDPQIMYFGLLGWYPARMSFAEAELLSKTRQDSMAEEAKEDMDESIDLTEREISGLIERDLEREEDSDNEEDNRPPPDQQQAEEEDEEEEKKYKDDSDDEDDNEQRKDKKKKRKNIKDLKEDEEEGEIEIETQERERERDMDVEQEQLAALPQEAAREDLPKEAAEDTDIHED